MKQRKTKKQEEDTNKDYVHLKISCVGDNQWSLKVSREYAERLMRYFHTKIFKRGTIQIGNFYSKQKLQVFNIKHIITMAITEEGDDE